jgi:squalene-associated FAD-dependent desaturase
VLVLEARARLGGRATAFPDRETGELVDNGQHVLLGCYTATFDFLREMDVLDHVRVQRELAITMIDRAGHHSRLVCPTLPAPFHLLAGVMEWDALDWRDRLAALRMTTPLAVARRQLAGGRDIAASPGETVDAWLVRNGQTDRLREMLWHPLALAALNQPPEVAAAPPFARVLAEMFGSDPRASAIALPSKPLDMMYAEPARKYVEGRGGKVMTGVTARVSVDAARVAAVDGGGERWPTSTVVSAVPWFALSAVFEPHPPELSQLIARAGAMASSPIITVNLWLDRPVLDVPFVGLPGRAMQWVFDKSVMFGGGASHLSLVSSGAPPLVDQTNEALIAAAHQELLEALPEIRQARLLRATVIREPRATFSLAPGQPPRPETRTPIRGLFLAGDWLDTGLPATIESAVRSGHIAADLAS